MLTSGKKGNKMCSETTHMICTWMVKFSESLLFKQLQRCMSGLEVEEVQLGGCCMAVYPVYPGNVVVATSWKQDEEDYHHFLTLHLLLHQYSCIYNLHWRNFAIFTRVLGEVNNLYL